jgi:hypothetical protein
MIEGSAREQPTSLTRRLSANQNKKMGATEKKSLLLCR